MAPIIKKKFDNPDNSLSFPKVKVETVSLGEFELSRMIFEPGWRWSDSLPEFIGTDTCQADHPVWMIVSGKFAVQMDDDGKTVEFGPGDLGMIPPGHDAWVIGDEPVVGIDFKSNNGKIESG